MIFHANYLQEQTVCMKYQCLFSWKNKKNIINLSYAESAQRVVKVNKLFDVVSVAQLVKMMEIVVLAT